MYNGANGDTFCEVLVSRRRGTPETVKAALAIIVGLLFSAVFYFAYSGMGIGDICCQNAEAGI